MVKKMSKEKEITISMSYRNKEFMKNCIILYMNATAASLLALIIYIGIISDEGTAPIPGFMEMVFLIAYGSATLLVVLAFWYNTAFVNRFTYSISEAHIIINQGVMTKTRVTIPYSRVQNIKIVNGVFDRIFKTFTVKIETAGSSGTARAGIFRPEGYIPGLKDPHIIKKKIKEMTKYSAVPSGLEDKIFKPEELAFDNFFSYILFKKRDGKNLKTNIKELREKASFSALELAEKVGVQISTINYLEEGRYNPDLALTFKIAEVLKCNIEDLFKLA